MYYNNKQTFYVKQYGPIVFIISFSVLLIGAGLYIYLKTNGGLNQLMGIKNTQVVEQNSLQNTVTETNTTVEVVKNLPTDLENLKPLDKKEVTGVTVTEYGSVICKYKEENIEVNLIGDDFSFTKNSTILKMRQDLSSKQLQIAFDKSKTEANKYYAYIYLDSKLYNEELLKEGLVKLRVERVNDTLLDQLLAAQLSAKIKNLGIWNF